MKFINKKSIFSMFLLSTCMILSSCGPKPTESFTITWKNDDGSVLKEEKVNSGVLPRFDGTPSKEGDEQYKYTFSGWNPEVVVATKDATYTATYIKEVRTYKITWKNYDGNILEENDVKYGEIPSYPGKTPTKPATDDYEYGFSHWEPELVPVTGEATYTANYNEFKRYLITWKNDDGSTLKTDRVREGGKPSFGGTPTKAEDAQYKYTFAGWVPELVPVTGPATYTATYISTLKSYEIKWVNYNGTPLKIENIPYGTTPFYTGSTPTRPSDEPDQYIYEFTGWDPAIVPVTKEATYTAQFRKKSTTAFTFTVSFPDDPISLEVGFACDDEIESVDWGDGVIDTNKEHTYDITEKQDFEVRVLGVKSNYRLGANSRPIKPGNCYVENVVLIKCTDKICDYAFFGCTSLSLIFLPNNVTTIGNSAFVNCSSLSSISVSNVTTVGESAFYNCSSLDSIALSDNATVIGNRAFYGCTSLESFTVPNGVTLIEDYTFYNCSSLTSISLHNNITSIGGSAFYNCLSLSSISLPNSITYIGYNAFSNCSSLKFNERDGALYLGNKDNLYLALIKAKSTSITSCYVDDNCKIIACSAFYNCSSLDSIALPDGLVLIGSYALSNCSSLISIDIPDSVTSLDDGAFTYSSNLQVVNFGESSQLRSIGDATFSGCRSLTSINIPNSIASCGTHAFDNCPIAYNQFNNGFYLGNDENPYLLLIKLRDKDASSFETNVGCKIICNDVFAGCSKLESLFITKNVVSISSYSFDNCSSLESLQVDSENQTFDSRNDCNAIIESSTNTLLFGCKSTIIPNDITAIGTNAFSDSLLTSIDIPDSVTSIGVGAFNTCPNLKSVNFGENSKLTEINNTAFLFCEELVSISIPKSVTKIGGSAFSSCSALDSIFIPKSVSYIGFSAFSQCNKLAFIYCEAPSQPTGWDVDWNGSSAEVIWDYHPSLN